MTDDTPGGTPQHYDLTPIPAQSRPRPHVPEPESREPQRIGDTIEELVSELTRLRGVIRNYRYDSGYKSVWRRLKNRADVIAFVIESHPSEFLREALERANEELGRGVNHHDAPTERPA